MSKCAYTKLVVYAWLVVGKENENYKTIKVLSHCSNAYKLHDNTVSVAKECWAFYPHNCLLFADSYTQHDLFNETVILGWK